MRIAFFVCAVALMAAVSSKSAFAIKEFGEQFGRVYVEGSKDEAFKALVAEAKTNTQKKKKRQRKQKEAQSLRRCAS